MSDIGIPVATLRQMATGQLLRVVHTILTIIAEQVEANPPVRGEEAPGTPPGLFVGPTLLGTPGSPEADGPWVDADWDSRLAEHIFPGDILSRPEVRAVPDLLPSTTSGCADWMAGCIDRSLSDGDLRNTLVAPSAPPSSSSSLAHDAVQEAEKKRRRLMVWPRER